MMLPKNWNITNLGALVDRLDSGVSVNGEDRTASEGEVGVLKISAVTAGTFDPSEHKVIRADEIGRARTIPRAGRIVVSRSNTANLVGASAYVNEDHPTLFLSDKLWQLEPSTRREVHMPWLAQWLSFDGTRSAISKLATGTSGSMKNISKEAFLSLQIPVPTELEQQRIACVLKAWDEAIATTKLLLSNSRRQKQTLVRRLIKRRRHGGVPQNDWSHVDFDSVFERVTRKNSGNNRNVLTISGEHGLIGQRDYFNKSVASDNLTGYTLLRHGEFAYNKSYSAGYPMGAIKPLQRYAVGVVSSLYICFRFRDDAAADADFFRHYFESGLLNDELTDIAQEGARNHGLLNVGVGDFFKLRLHIPGLREQRRIAGIVNMAESKERVIAEQIAKLRDEKRALMQQLLTGKRRVRLPQATATEIA